MKLFEGPPYFKAFVYPLLSAAAAGGMGFGLGYIIGTVTATERPDITGWSISAVAAVMVWTIDHFTWMAIIDRAWIAIIRMEEARAHPEPAPEAARMKMVVTSEDKTRGEFIDLPANGRQLYQFACGMLKGAPATYRQWTNNGTPFTQAEFSQLMTEMVGQGLAERGRNGSIQLTAAGRMVMTGVKEQRISPIRGRNSLLDDGFTPYTQGHTQELAEGEWSA